MDHILSETICLFCFCILFSNMYPKIKFTSKNWSDLCNSYIKVIFLNFRPRKYFYFFFAKLELLIFHNSFSENFRKIEQAELVENLPPRYIRHCFLHNLHSSSLREKVKKFDLKKKKKKTTSRLIDCVGV